MSSSAWKSKRFWTDVSVVAAPGGFTVHLDARPVRTPAKAPLIVPTRALAEAIATEWDTQQGLVRPDSMPITRGANSAIDKVAVQHAEVADLIAAYGESDLLCYRAIDPPELIRRQAAGWDPILAWAADTLEAPLQIGHGVMPVDQNRVATDRLGRMVHALDSFRLAGFYDLVAISGSLVLGLAVMKGRLTADNAWRLSRIDEDWQIEIWGHDDEAEASASAKMHGFANAARFLDLLDKA